MNSIDSISSVERDLSTINDSQPSENGSVFREVFGSDSLKQEFANFLNTIFYQLDEQKVFQQMDKILQDSNKTDEEIYNELVSRIDDMRRNYGPSLFYKLKALAVLQKGMGLQAAQLLQGFRKESFNNYLEIYFRRYLKTIQKAASLPFKGLIYSVSDKEATGTIQERIEAGSLFSSYPYRNHVPLNDADCMNPELEPEKTSKPIGDEVEDGQIDLITCLGGLHHIPKERLEPFVESLSQKLAPGAVLLVRDHDVTNQELARIVSMVHTFVNAENKVSYEVEAREVREFRSAKEWTDLLKNHHFARVSSENLVLDKDPTQNGMMAFVKLPQNGEQLKQAIRYRTDCIRAPSSSMATWIEWGNVRYAKQYAEFIQNNHAYAFDYIGHLKQHWTHFTQYLRNSESRTTDDFMMNFCIFTFTLFECATGFTTSLPAKALARLKHGSQWRNVKDLTSLEKYEAAVEKEYSEFIDHTPFYQFPYLSKVEGLWRAALFSNESIFTKMASSVSAIFSTLRYAAKAAISIPPAFIYRNADGSAVEPDLVSITIYDPNNRFSTGEKQIGGKMEQIKVVYETNDHHKVVLVPRYRPFTELCKELACLNDVKLLQIGGNETVTVDVLYQKGETNKVNLEPIYELERLQDENMRRYATYQVPVKSLADFEKSVGLNRIEYVHE